MTLPNSQWQIRTICWVGQSTSNSGYSQPLCCSCKISSSWSCSPNDVIQLMRENMIIERVKIHKEKYTMQFEKRKFTISTYLILQFGQIQKKILAHLIRENLIMVRIEIQEAGLKPGAELQSCVLQKHRDSPFFTLVCRCKYSLWNYL